MPFSSDLKHNKGIFSLIFSDLAGLYHRGHLFAIVYKSIEGSGLGDVFSFFMLTFSHLNLWALIFLIFG